LADRGLKVGDVAPAFELHNQGGEPVRSADLLGRGPLVITFFRGHWRPYCMRELEALQAATVADVGTDRDEELVDALRLREPTAAERLIARYGDRAYRLAVRITGNAEDAEEVVQDAILSVVRKIDTFRGESAFGSWFYRIVSNAAYGRRRPQASMEIPLEEVLPAFDEHGRHASLFRDWSSSVDDPAVQKQLRDVLTSAIDELPPHYRAAIVLRDVEGLPTAEVADALGIPVSTAKTRAHRARLLLRKRLSTFMEIERPSETEVPTRSSEG
jgi:RNA polymerase sigma-70 factor, ECF subfamily